MKLTFAMRASVLLGMTRDGRKFFIAKQSPQTERSELEEERIRRMDEAMRRKRTFGAALGLLVAFLLLGLYLVLEIRSAQVGIWSSNLSVGEKYLWFARLQTSKAVIAFVALVAGLVGASYARRAGQRPE